MAIIDVKILYFQVIADPGQSDNESGLWINMKIESFAKLEEAVKLNLNFIFCTLFHFNLSVNMYD